MNLALIPIKELIKKGWQIYTKNLKEFVIPIIMAIPFYLIAIFYPFIYSYLTNYFTAFISGIITFIIFLICLGLYIMAMISLIRLINSLLHNKKNNINKLVNESTKGIFSYFWIGILTFVVMLIGFILLIIPGLFFMVWYAFSVYVYVLEDKDTKGLAALKSSKKLIKGRAWDVFGRIFVPVIFIEIIMYLAALALFGILLLMGLGFEISGMVTYGLFILAILILLPLFISFEVILYNNLKETRKL